MPLPSETILALIVGLGLSAACGFRVFVPPLIISIAALSGHLELSPGFAWVATYPALIALATASVLEEHLPSSPYSLHGRRVVEGQRLIQTSSDIFLGWSRSVSGHDYYWRQLKDWKGSADLDRIPPKRFFGYARLCGLTLARAHAVSGDPAAIAGYLGKGDVFDKAIGEFAVRYAEQNLTDYQAFAAAIDAGGLEAHLAV